MATYQIRNLSTNIIYQIYESDTGVDKPRFSGEWNDDSLFIHEAMPSNDIDSADGTEMWRKVRAERDSLLIEDVDLALKQMQWADANGAAWTSQQISDWVDYRQDLLDVPETIQALIDGADPLSDIKDLDFDGYNWPTKP